MLKGNCRKKNLTACERKISSYKPAFTKEELSSSYSCQLQFVREALKCLTSREIPVPLSLRLEREETLKYCCVCRPLCGKV